MAQGSQKKWGGWETRACAICGVRITLAHSYAMHCYEGGLSFSLCGEHIGSYSAVRRAYTAAALTSAPPAPVVRSGVPPATPERTQ